MKRIALELGDHLLVVPLDLLDGEEQTEGLMLMFAGDFSDLQLAEGDAARRWIKGQPPVALEDFLAAIDGLGHFFLHSRVIQVSGGVVRGLLVLGLVDGRRSR